ncbi:MAG: ribonuclease E inhibitor RraB [Planctomycetaceae bacterium]|nr:ribonuclease E inhibitor RraB [Planctomycetaceae bacterium]
MITRDQVERLFEHTRELRREGRVDWDIDGVCRWTYFFVDSSRARLTRLGEHLAQHGYENAGLMEPSPEDVDQETIHLQVEKVERHTVDSLLARNDELYALARRFKVRDYDGMDNGPAEGP